MIFLSYSREDRTDAVQLVKKIEQWGVELYRDPQAVEGNPLWRKDIKKVWANCDVLLVLWSKNAAASPWVEHEIRGFNKAKAFVPLDLTPIPDDATCLKTDNELKVFLAQKTTFAIDQAKPQTTTVTKTSRHRSQMVIEYTQRVQELIQIISPPTSPRQVSDSTWQISDGSLLKLVKNSSKKNRSHDLLVGIQPVTNRQFSGFLSSICWPNTLQWNEKKFQSDSAPVVGINWFEALAYCLWNGCRLPTVEEWEAAAQAGTDDCVYATSDGQINSRNCHYNNEFAEGHPIDPKILPPNPKGFYGMSGNIWDWCNETDGPFKVIKGGGYMDAPAFCKITSAYRNFPIDRDCCVGFRLALSLPKQGLLHK